MLPMGMPMGRPMGRPMGMPMGRRMGMVIASGAKWRKPDFDLAAHPPKKCRT